MGGKSSSSTSVASEQTTTTTSAGATGTVGDVIQGQTVTITDNLPERAVDVFEQLVNLAGQSASGAADIVKKALDAVDATSNKAVQTVAQSAKEAAQPDLAILQGSQKQIYYAIGASALVLMVMFWRKR